MVHARAYSITFYSLLVHIDTDRCAVIAVRNIEQLEENVRVARAFQTLDAAALSEIEKKTANAWQNNAFFRAWT